MNKGNPLPLRKLLIENKAEEKSRKKPNESPHTYISLLKEQDDGKKLQSGAWLQAHQPCSSSSVGLPRAFLLLPTPQTFQKTSVAPPKSQPLKISLQLSAPPLTTHI